MPPTAGETVSANGRHTTAALLDQLLAPHPPAFALLHRPHAGPDAVDVIIGTAFVVDRLADLPLPGDPGSDLDELVVLVPYRQIVERGFTGYDDRAPLVAIRPSARATVSRARLCELLPDEEVRLDGGAFDLDDQEYAAAVRRVLTEEIGRGEGANFVLKRSFLATVPDFSVRTALAMFRRLLSRETGAYWTFAVHTGDRTLIGASPELHVGVDDRRVRMNPISGTYRYPADGPSVPGALRFLDDPKEIDELYMVLDEELKMMARICPDGGLVRGPHLTPMARLAHTAYYIEGDSDRDLRDILRESLFAPTVTGSPVENAYRVIHRHERRSRGYYSGVLAHFSRDSAGLRRLDSSIVIRTADIDRYGRLDLAVGSTLVRHSDPAGEVAETHGKAVGVLSVFDRAAGHTAAPATPPASLASDPGIRAALARRNDRLARFWFDRDTPAGDPALLGRRVLLVDAEDTFTAMLTQQLRALGLVVELRGHRQVSAEEAASSEYDLLVAGPGPGDPRGDDPKIRTLLDIIEARLNRRAPLLAVCLSHQVLCRHLGLTIVRRSHPNQGVQQEIDLFGERVRAGFYNTYAARSTGDELELPAPIGTVRISRDPAGGEVHALGGEHFRSVQFHPESILTQHGVAILAAQLRPLLAAPGLAAPGLAR
ncbi:anthranilate synthase family protein [Actinoplanes sp. CA-015351]|uniref:anthranilate synthase family protein n=1 Tax=Actinoplanes sp. CA-015351 TaxID=3239897 RepID=UPI003D96E1CE